MTKQIKKIPQKEYSRDYFLNSTSGAGEFKKSWGRILSSKHAFALQQVEIEPKMRVLDVGCGRGEIMIHSAQQGAEATGIDYAEAAVKLAKQAIAKQPQKIQKKIKLIRGNICRLPFNNETFDRIFFLDVIEHLTPEQGEKALAEIKRVLKIDGLLVLHTWPNDLFTRIGFPYWSWPLTTILILIKGGDMPSRRLEPNLYDRVLHVNVQNYFTLRQILKEVGFKTKFILKIDSFPKMNFKDQLLFALYKAMPFSLTWPLNILFCDNLWVVAKRR